MAWHGVRPEHRLKEDLEETQRVSVLSSILCDDIAYHASQLHTPSLHRFELVFQLQTGWSGMYPPCRR